MAVDKMAVFNSLEDIISTTCNDNCSECEKTCIMRYAKEYVNACKELKCREIKHGFERIPTNDYSTYDQDVIIDGIARMLAMCHDCEADHSCDCVINVVRSCFEHTLMAETVDYPGNAIAYLMQLNSKTPLVAEIMDKYKEYKG